MTRIAALDTAPTLEEEIERLREDDSAYKRYPVQPCELELQTADEAPMVSFRGASLSGDFRLSERAVADMARLGRTPVPFFKDCSPALKATIFKARKNDGQMPLQVVIREGILDRVLNGNLLPLPTAQLLETVRNTIPEGARAEDLRVIGFSGDERFDISVIAGSLTTEPRPGDVVAFGVSLREGRDGALQIGSATYRLICANGAISRTCDGSEHRLRRPLNRADRQGEFLRKAQSFLTDSWGQRQAIARKLSDIQQIVLDRDGQEGLRMRLRQAPFFLTARLARQVLDRLMVEAGDGGGPPTMFNLWNAMSFLGTHADLPDAVGHRLRLGAGEFTRIPTEICGQCRQLVLEDNHSTTKEN